MTNSGFIRLLEGGKFLEGGKIYKGKWGFLAMVGTSKKNGKMARFFVLKSYKEGKISLGKAAKQLDLTISEMIELLADFGIPSPVNYDEYLEGYHAFKDGFGIAKGAQPFDEKD